MTPPNNWEVRFQFARLDAWLHELETDNRYRYRLVDLEVNVEFIALTHERRMLITDVD